MNLDELKSVNVSKNTAVKRGEVYWVDSPRNTIGSEQQGKRPALIVSNDIGNSNAPVVEIVYITTGFKAKLPTHYNVLNPRVSGIALCENINTIDKSRIEERITELTPQQMKEIDRCLCISLEITKKPGTMAAAEVFNEPVIKEVTVDCIDNISMDPDIEEANGIIKQIIEAGNKLANCIGVIKQAEESAQIGFIGYGSIDINQYVPKDIMDGLKEQVLAPLRNTRDVLKDSLKSIYTKVIIPEKIKSTPVAESKSENTAVQAKKDKVDHAEFKNLYMSGVPVSEIVDKLGMTSTSVYQLASKMGLKRVKKQQVAEKSKKESTPSQNKMGKEEFKRRMLESRKW